MVLTERQEVFMYKRIRYLQRLITLMQLSDNTNEYLYHTAINELDKTTKIYNKGSI